MSDVGPGANEERPKPRGEAGWKAHLQEIAAKNDRVRAVGRRERQEREEQAASQRRAAELRMEAELAGKAHGRYSN